MILEKKTNLEDESNINLLDKLKRDTFQYAPAIIIPALLNLIAVVIFTRIFNPNEYGVYNLIISSSTVISMIFSQWIMQGTQKFRPEYIRNNEIEEFNSNIKFLIIILTIFIALLSTFIYLFIKNVLQVLTIKDEIFFSSVILIFLQILFNVGIVIFQSDLKASRYRFYQLLNGMLRFVLSIIIITLLYKDVIGIIWASALSLIIIIMPMYKELGLFNLYSNKLNINKFLFFLKKMLKYGIPMIGWFLGNSLLGLSDRYLLSYFRGQEEVGIYSANYSLVSMGLGLICGPLLTAAHPVIMNSVRSDNYSIIQKDITRFSRMFLLFSIPFSCFIIFFSSEIVAVVLGENFKEGSIIFPFLVIGTLVWNLAMYGHKGHEILGKTKVMMFFVLISVIVNVLGNIILIPDYGYLGAAIATLLGYLCYPFLIYISSANNIKWVIPWISLFKILFSAVISCWTVVIITSSFQEISTLLLILKISISIIIVTILYLFLLKLFKELKL